MPFTYFDHTGDVGVHILARTLDDLFRDAAGAFTDVVADAGRVEARRSIPVTLASSALDLLLVDFLDEILYRFDAEHFLVAAARVHVGKGVNPFFPPTAAFALDADLGGETLDPERHGVKVLIKGVTYHALEVREDADGWHATVVFDI